MNTGYLADGSRWCGKTVEQLHAMLRSEAPQQLHETFGEYLRRIDAEAARIHRKNAAVGT